MFIPFHLFYWDGRDIAFPFRGLLQQTPSWEQRAVLGRHYICRNLGVGLQPPELQKQKLILYKLPTLGYTIRAIHMIKYSPLAYTHCTEVDSFLSSPRNPSRRTAPPSLAPTDFGLHHSVAGRLSTSCCLMRWQSLMGAHYLLREPEMGTSLQKPKALSILEQEA